MKKSIASFLCAFALPLAALAASDLKEAKFTQVVNDVQIIKSSKAIQPAAVNALFDIPDILRTGPASRAELVAADRTITRVGANTIFSFDQANRTIDLQQGSLLFHSDHGKGGGTIRTGAATASVLGTTIIVVTTPNGGFKILVLEGHCDVRYANGRKQKLNAGQMTFVLPGSLPAPVLFFRLDEQVKNSLLVNGFTIPLSSLPLISKVVATQTKLLLSGVAVDTGLLVGDSASPTTVQSWAANFANDRGDLDQEQSSGSSGGGGGGPLTGADLALTEDFTIPAIDPNNVFIIPGFDIAASSGDISSPAGFLANIIGNPFYGFPGHNITINGPTIDLSPFAAQVALNLHEYFDFVAMNNINIQGTVTFDGLLAGEGFYLSAGNQLLIASGSTVEADFDFVQLSSLNSMTLDHVNVINNAGDLELLSQSDLEIYDSHVLAPNGTLSISSGGTLSFEVGGAGVVPANLITAGSDISLNGANGVSIDNTAITSTGGMVNIHSGNGPISITDKSLITANGDVTLNGAAPHSSVVIKPSLAARPLAAVAPTSGTVVNSTAGSITANNVSFQDDTVGLNAGNQISLTDGSIDANTTVGMAAANNINISGTTISASDTSAGTIGIASNQGAVTFNNGATLQAVTVTVGANGDLTIGNATVASGHAIPPVGSALNLTSASGTATLNNMNVSSFLAINMQAPTIVVLNTIFGSDQTLNFRPATAVANIMFTPASVIAREFNCYNISVGGTPISSLSQINISSLPTSTPGVINVY